MMNVRTSCLLVVFLLALALAPPAAAVQGCSTAMLSGNYGLQFSGTYAPALTSNVGGVKVAKLKPAQMGSGPVAGIARLYLDGNGSVNGYSAVDAQGSWVQGNVTGSYTVNQDCTAALVLTDDSGDTENYGGVVVNAGESMIVVETDPGAAVSGAMRPARGNCQTSDMAGTFGIQASGSDANGTFSSTGVVALDGLGDATAAEWRLSGASYSPVASVGSFAINPDCSSALALTSQVDGSTLNYFGLIVYQQTGIPQLWLVRSDAGAAVTGTVTAQ